MRRYEVYAIVGLILGMVAFALQSQALGGAAVTAGVIVLAEALGNYLA